MSDKTYIEKTRGTVTASKLKDYLLCPYLYKIKYIDEVDLEKDEEEARRCFVLGTAFHELVERGKERRFEKYYILDDGMVKTKLQEAIRKEIMKFEESIMKYQDEAFEKIQDKMNTLKSDSGKEKYQTIIDEGNAMKMIDRLDLTQLRAIYYNNTSGEMVQLTPAEGRDLVGMYESVYKQPIWDMGGSYEREVRLTAKYQELQLSAQLDRLLFYKHIGEETDVDVTEDMRMTIKEVEEMLFGKTLQEQQEIIKKNGIRAVIRDFKTTGDLSKVMRELDYDGDTRFGYAISMSFYFTIVFLRYGILAEVFLDMVEKKAPYASATINLNSSRMANKLKNIIKPGLKSLQTAKESGEYALPDSRDAIITDLRMKEYYEYFPMYQESPRTIDLDI